MASAYEIPLQPNPQVLSVSLSGVTYRLSLKWRDASDGGWSLDIADISGTPILCGVPLVTGVDLLEQYGYLNFDGGLWVQTGSDPDAVPTFNNLGGDAKLYWVSAP